MAEAQEPRLASSADAALVRRKVEGLLATVGKSTRVGLMVVDVRDGAVWVARQPDLALKPASVLKLFTTAAALTRLGPEFTYETRLLRLGDDLWLLGAGDPGLGDERLAQRDGLPPDHVIRAWRDAVRAAGTPPKRVIVDDTIFDSVQRHPSWPADQELAWYQAPVGGVNFNDNCVDSSAAIRDGAAVVTLVPPLPAAFVRNSLRVGKTHNPSVHREAGSDILLFRGSITRRTGFESIAVNQPWILAGEALHQVIQTEFPGSTLEVARGRLGSQDAARARLVWSHATPLKNVLWRANTFSQNLFAEALIKSIDAYEPGGARSARSGGWPGGAAALVSTLNGLGVNMEAARVADGSGLSHDNRVTAEQTVSLLTAMFRGPNRSVFFESLAIPGQPGTMQRSYGRAPFVDRLRAKTGTIDGVHALAGYARGPGGVDLAFAVFVNGPGGGDLPRRIAEALVSDGEK